MAYVSGNTIESDNVVIGKQKNSQSNSKLSTLHASLH